MVMLEQMQSEPEPETLELGEIDLIFEGSVSDPRSEARVEQYIALLQDAVSDRRFEYSFYHSDRVVSISNIAFELDEIVDGSIVAKTKIIGAFLIASYGAAASYPSFKEAVPIIANDLSVVIDYVIENAPRNEEDLPPPYRVDMIFKEEDEIEDQINMKKF
jgi:hypothetical protein